MLFRSAGRFVLDFASGSGLVGIAAMKAGAGRVVAAEIDDFAVRAIAANAEANGVELPIAHEDLIGRDDGWDVILAGDVFYEKPLADRLVLWLSDLTRRGATVLIGDPGRSYLPRERLAARATYSVPVTRALEDSEIKKTTVWVLESDIPAA